MGGIGLAFPIDMKTMVGTALGAAVALHPANPALAAAELSISWGPDKTTRIASEPAEDCAVIRLWEGLLHRALGAPCPNCPPPPCPMDDTTFMGARDPFVLPADLATVGNPTAAQVAVKRGSAACLREQTNFKVEANSSHPDARRHRIVPCVVEEGGRLGEYLLAMLKELAERG
eukprot:jgi/Tetstr1/421344/TSEL_012314.t1